MSKWKWIILGVLIVVFVPVLAMFYKESFGPQVHSISLQYLSGAEAASMLRRQMSVEGWSEHAVFIRGYNSDVRKATNLLLAEDKPTPQVVALKFQIIEADGFTQHDPAIAPVESVLHGLFRFQGYRLAAEAYLSARANSESQQTVAGVDDAQYMIDVKVGDVVRREGKASAELEATLWTNVPVLKTAVNVPNGQTVVLGTARPSAKRAALILVVTPEIK